MNVLFVGKRFYTNRDALRERYGRIYQLPWHWSKDGIATRLWLIDYHSRESVRLRDGGLEVVSTPVKALATPLAWAREVLHRHRPPDVVLASGDCYIGLLAYCAARLLRARFVFDVYDKYDEFPGYHRAFLFDPFRFLLLHADARLFASKLLMSQLHAKNQLDFLVPNGICADEFYPRDTMVARRALGLDANLSLVGYFGSLDVDRGILDLIEAARLLQVTHPALRLLLGGTVAAGVSIAYPWVIYLGDLPATGVPIALAACDVLALPYRRTTYLDSASSCKIAEYIASGRPMAATRTPNFTENFPMQAMELSSLLAIPGDPVDIARVIAQQLERRFVVQSAPDMSWASIARSLASQLFGRVG